MQTLDDDGVYEIRGESETRFWIGLKGRENAFPGCLKMGLRDNSRPFALSR